MTRKTTFIFDTPTGVYKNPTLSAFIQRWVKKRTILEHQAHWVDMTGRKRGESVILKALTRVPPQEALSETVPIPEEPITELRLVAQEWGTAFPYESMDDFRRLDRNHPLQKALLQRALVITESVVASAFKSTPVKFVPGHDLVIEDGVLTVPAWGGLRAKIALRLGLDNRRGIRAKGLLSVEDLDRLLDALQYTYDAPMVDGMYRVIVGAKLGRALGRSPQFDCRPSTVTAAVPGCTGVLCWAGRRCLVIQVNDRNLVGDEEAIVYGDEAVCAAVAQPLEVRAAIPQDYGRTKAIALYGVYASSLFFPGVENCRVIHVTDGPDIPGFWPQLRDNLRFRKAAFLNRRKASIANVLRALADKLSPTNQEDYD